MKKLIAQIGFVFCFIIFLIPVFTQAEWKKPLIIHHSNNSISAEYPALNTIDGNISTEVKSESASCVNIVYDLGSRFTIEKIKLYTGSKAVSWDVFISDEEDSTGMGRKPIQVISEWNTNTSGWNESASMLKVGRYITVSGHGMDVFTDGLYEFEFYGTAPRLTVLSISPNIAENIGAMTQVTITGTEFLAGAGVKLIKTGENDINAANVVVPDSRHISCEFNLSGLASAGHWDVIVVNPNGETAKLNGLYTVDPTLPPAVTSITPNQGSNTGSVHIIDLAGSNFISGAAVKLVKSGETDIPGTKVMVRTSGRITCEFNLDGVDSGNRDIVVINPNGLYGTLPGGFNVVYSQIIFVPTNYSTIQSAINSAPYGATIRVAKGTYNESISLKNGITLQGGWNSAFTVRDPSNNETIITGGAGGSNGTINGFTISNPGRVVFDLCHSVLNINNNIIKDSAGGVHLCVSGAKITNNIFQNISGSAVDVCCCSPYGPLIANNIFISNSRGVSICEIPVPIINNTFVKNTVAIDICCFKAEVTNCIFWQNTSDFSGCGMAAGSGASVSYSATDKSSVWGNTGGNIFNVDPLFANAALNNFHITGTSSCIDKGTTVYEPVNDKDGDPRAQGLAYDIGADEYMSPANCPSGPAVFQFNEPSGSVTCKDEEGVVEGIVANPSGSFTGDGYFHGDGINNYIDFMNNDDCFISPTTMTLEARVKPAVMAGAGADTVLRIFARTTATQNYQLSVWRIVTGSGYPNYTPPPGVGSFAFWTASIPQQSGELPWKPVLTDYTKYPVVANHWYQVKVVWNSGKTGGIPCDIYVDDQGIDGNNTGENWQGFVNCTDSDQSQLTPNRYLHEGDTMQTGYGDFSIGINPGNHNFPFNGLIDWIKWQNTANYPAPVDTTPPLTTTSLSGIMGNNSWYVSDGSIALSATDSDSGVKEIHYSINGGAELIENGDHASISLAYDGIYNITYYAIDNALNPEAPKNLTVKIDKTSPVTSAEITGTMGNNGWYTSDVTIRLLGIDPVSGVKEVHYTVQEGR